MIINIVNSNEMKKKNVWSVNFLFPQEEIKAVEGYSLVQLSELVDERRETITLTGDYGEVHYVGLENIEPRTGRLVDFTIKHCNDIKSSCKLFKYGDILFGRLRPNLNKVLFNDFFQKGECSTEIIVLVPRVEYVDPLYLSELLRTESINRRIVNIVKGAALPRVSMADLKQLQLPIPPLDEQQRIAKIITQKREELDEHIKRVRQIPIELNDILSASFA
ncbi:MAG: restriction endonuclease subunit S [Clostridia bacterium]|nr:restriction endonuclease subunit S [Clostridia bacterium]